MLRLFVCCVFLLLISSFVHPFPDVQVYPTLPTPQSNQPYRGKVGLQVNVPQGRPMRPTDRIEYNGRNNFHFVGPQGPFTPQYDNGYGVYIPQPNPQPVVYYPQFYIDPQNQPIYNQPYPQPIYNQQYYPQPFYNQQPIYNMPY